MSNVILTDAIIAKEALRLLENNLVFTRGVNRKYEPGFNQEHKVGSTINVRVPAQFTVRTGATASIQDYTDSVVPVTISTQKGVDVNFYSSDLALSLNDFSENVLAPQIATLASAIDYDGLLVAKNSVASSVGTPGTDPSTLLVALQAGQKLDEAAAPQDGKRSIILSPRQQVSMVSGLSTLFNSAGEISSQYEKGKMGQAAGFDWAMSQNLPTHVFGPQGGTPLVVAAVDGASSVTSNGWTASAAVRLNQGDVITFAGVHSVNPYTKQSTGTLKQFVVTASVSSDGSGNATIPIYPALHLAGAQQNVDALPAGSAAIAVMGTASQSSGCGLAFHKDAFTLAMAEMPLPKGMDMAKNVSSKNAGLTIRFIRGYDITNDRFISRLDVLYGWKAIRPELACRIQGA